MRKKNEQVKELYRVQAEVMQKRSENEQTRLKSQELSHELKMLNNYTGQLSQNLQSLITDYSTQYANLTQTIDKNNESLDVLRRDLSDSTAQYNDLRVTLLGLETEVDALQVRHDRDTGVNEDRRIN
jgi:chromosome segregation ATPase